jgi:hypothetical protein
MTSRVIVTADQVKAAAVKAGIFLVARARCAECECWTFYRVVGGALYFDPTCGCSRFHADPEPCSWQEAADWINGQEHEEQRISLHDFGFFDKEVSNAS